MQGEYDRNNANRLMKLIVENNVDRYSLKEAEVSYQATADCFWGTGCYERPPLPEALAIKD